jgi:hypothetical protein
MSAQPQQILTLPPVTVPGVRAMPLVAAAR